MRLPERLKARLEEYAEGRTLSLNQAARELLEDALNTNAGHAAGGKRKGGK